LRFDDRVASASESIRRRRGEKSPGAQRAPGLFRSTGIGAQREPRPNRRPGVHADARTVVVASLAVVAASHAAIGLADPRGWCTLPALRCGGASMRLPLTSPRGALLAPGRLSGRAPPGRPPPGRPAPSGLHRTTAARRQRGGCRCRAAVLTIASSAAMSRATASRAAACA